jgi:3-hydroxyisobutyrate dehydrogenase-like beta-hydroxyacid dehydrogenase
VAAEAFSMAVAAGMEPRRLFDILSRSGGTSSQFVKRFPWAVEGDFAPRFTVALAAKDLGLALDLADSVGMPAPMTASARELYQKAMAEDLGGKDMVVFVDVYRQWAARE